MKADLMTRFNIARCMLVFGIMISLVSLTVTIGHIGDRDYLLAPGMDADGEAIITTHAWYHALREACGDLSVLVVLLVCFFGSVKFRTKETWSLCLILLIGYFAPFWIGIPFNNALSAPNWMAEIVHIAMALFTLGALVLANPSFSGAAR